MLFGDDELPLGEQGPERANKSPPGLRGFDNVVKPRGSDVKEVPRVAQYRCLTVFSKELA